MPVQSMLPIFKHRVKQGQREQWLTLPLALYIIYPNALLSPFHLFVISSLCMKAGCLHYCFCRVISYKTHLHYSHPRRVMGAGVYPSCHWGRGSSSPVYCMTEKNKDKQTKHKYTNGFTVTS